MSSSVHVVIALCLSLGFDRCGSARSTNGAPRSIAAPELPAGDGSALVSSQLAQRVTRSTAQAPSASAADARSGASPLFDAATLARLYASAPTARLREVRRGLGLCRLSYAPPSSRTSTASRWLAGLATAGLSELIVRSEDADFFAPDLRLDAQFGSGPTVVASARDQRSTALVAVPVERLERGSTVRFALFDRDTVSADDELLRRSVVWSGERSIAVASRGASVSCRLLDWAALLPRATSVVREAERRASSLAARAERVASAIRAARTPSALVDAAFEAELARAEGALLRAAPYAAVNPEWSEFSQVSRALDGASRPARTARLERVRRGFGETPGSDSNTRYVTGQCVDGRLRVSFELGRAPAPSRVIAIEWSGATRLLPGAVRARRGARTFVASPQAARSGARCEAPLALVTLSGSSSALRMVNGGLSAP